MPERSCVVCRKTGEKKELLRFVRGEQRPFFFLDFSASSEGRGAYVHPTPSCFGSLKFGAKIARTLRFKASGQKAWSKEEETTAFLERYQQLDKALCGEKLRRDGGISLVVLQQLRQSCGEYLGKIDKRDDSEKNRSAGDAKKQKRLSGRPKVRL